MDDPKILKPLKIKEDTYNDLTALKGKLTQQTMKSTNYDEAIRDLLTISKISELFAHINVYDDHVTIADGTQLKFVNVYFNKQGKPWCDLDEKSNCDHVKYALQLPEVKQAFKKKGIRIPNTE